MLTKREWLDRYKRGLRYATPGLEEVQVRRYGDVAVAVARQVARARTGDTKTTPI